MGNPEKSSEVLQEEIQKRKEWFFECQLRRLYMDAYRDVETAGNDAALLKLISEPLLDLPALGITLKNSPLVYLDSGQEVWTREERDRRLAFKDITTGSYGNWLNYGETTRLAEKLAHLKSVYLDSKYQSNWDLIDELNTFKRENPFVKIDPDPAKAIGKDHDLLAHAISRAAIAETKPWLIPEIFNDGSQPLEFKKWIENGEVFVSNYENELNEVPSGPEKPKDPFNPKDPEVYRTYIKAVISNRLKPERAKGSRINVHFFDRSKEAWTFNIQIQTLHHQALSDVRDYPYSQSVKYWIDACVGKLTEIYVHKSESDMGLCLVMRTLYLYGTLDAASFSDNDIRWRKRSDNLNSYAATFNTFFDKQIKLIDIHLGIADKDEWRARLTNVKIKLMIWLEETAAAPRIGSACFSPLAQDIMKLAILKYKFWLDEPYHAYDYHNEDQKEDKAAGINKARINFNTGMPFAEMEFWSENHYIMFASSEYLAGQLWPDDSFQPATDFLRLEDLGVQGVLTGVQRMQRGKSRILKWLNNKLMFGWTEFNSSGYYREHLWALLNLVDFALDEEVVRKATIVTDLLLFDVMRFLHKGSMGACGGRSQFPSKNSGWDNALGDAIEIMLGQRGVFTNKDGEVGCSFATSSYTIPAVLLQIANYPPEVFHIDRCRVSIGFDEAPKYGIDYSQHSDQFDSLFEGYAPKRAKYSAFANEVNAAITASHTDYGPWQDDTMFWWSQSAFFNKQNVRNTFKCVNQFKLDKCKAFGKLKWWFGIIAGIIKGKDILGLAAGAARGILGLTASGPVFFDDATSHYLEVAGDDLSIFFEGSTRSRVNIYTGHSRDIMLSSIQNFRTGQLNFQSAVNQATISTGINVFTTAGFPGISLSDLPFALAGLPVGALAGGIANAALFAGTGGLITAVGAAVGAAGGIYVNRKFVDGVEIGDQGDGPGWWTGNYALPMVVQHESAAIIMYDFNWLQRRLTTPGSHVWFPKMGFDKTNEMRSSSYEDSNNFITDFSLDFKQFPTFGYDVRGYWLFGQKIHQRDPQNPDNNEEAYIGVFSNRSPDWQNQDSDFYSDQISKVRDPILKDVKDAIAKLNKKLEDAGSVEKAKIINEIKNLFEEERKRRRTWPDPLPVDFFAEKDWYAAGKNIWIIQVGNKSEYGSYENFKEKVSSAKVVLDDAGDMECAYHIPKPDGSKQVLSVKYKDEIKLDGADFQADFYPRFENKFVRGGRVEWGQREYVIEYNGEFLFHDFSNMDLTARSEEEVKLPADAFTIKGLVIYIKTADEEMEVFTVATATVNIGCKAVAVDEVIAAGQVNENNFHDAEWIFFDMSAINDPDMTIDIAHHSIPGKKDDDTEWKMTYTMKALMGDRSLKQCTVQSIPLGTYYFRDKSRNTGAIPFSIQLLKWRSWKILGNITQLKTWMIAGQPGNDFFNFDYLDQLGIDKEDILWHRRLGLCNAVPSWTQLSSKDHDPELKAPFSIFPFSAQPDYLYLFLISKGEFYARWIGPGHEWSSQPWTKLNLSYQPKKIPLTGILPPPLPVPLWPLSFVYATFINYSVTTPAVYVSGMDGNIYVSFKWPLDGQGHWRKIETASVFSLLHIITFRVADNFLFAMDITRSLWQITVSPEDEIFPASWEQLPASQFTIESFVVTDFDGMIQVIACSNEGTVWGIRRDNIEGAIWQRVGQKIDFKTFPGAEVNFASGTTGRVDIFVIGVDGKLYSTWWTEKSGWENDHNWSIVSEDSQEFKAAKNGNIAAISRVNGQIEIYTTDTVQNIWKNWWS